MNPNRRKLGLAALGATALAWASAGAACAQAAGPIKVGVILPLSGGAGPQGQHVTQAIQAMAALINEDGGVLGRPLEIVARDDESTPAVGVSRATELVGQGVAVILEGWNSPVALAMQPVIHRAGVLDITLFASADAMLSGEGNPLAMRLNASNTQGGAAVAQVIAGRLKARRVAFLTENDAYGNGTQASIEAELKRLGYAYEKVAEEKFPFTQADFRVALTNVRAANPEVTVAINANEGLGMPAILRQFKQGRVPGQLLAALGTVAPSVISVAGDAANGAMGVDIYFPDVEPFASNPVNKRFVAKVQALHGNTPDKFMAVGAAALQVWAMAASELKTLEREPVARRIRGGSFQGTVFGDVSFAPDGQLQSRTHVFQVRDGRIVVQK
ncbi:ABC transporter substrate-binding protein [Aquincola tertiaricarbonis]|uniref:ABC transporter substrate-binding protein n=1 Tax=Aquincola tertiaricarbonis TaxID=391953 RepID=UPI0009F841B5|nr:ABC transporter substrate-binding protein [Aquincola tertiaricarbonis]